MRKLTILAVLFTACAFGNVTPGDRQPQFVGNAIMFWQEGGGWESRVIKIRSYANWIALACFRAKPKDTHVECFFQTNHGAEQQREEIIGETHT